jgi:hypothetical protein
MRHANPNPRSVLKNSGFNPIQVEPVRYCQRAKRTPKERTLSVILKTFPTLHVKLSIINNATYTYMFEDDIELSVAIDTHELHFKLDSIESLRPNIIYLGGCAEHIRKEGRSPWIAGYTVLHFVLTLMQFDPATQGHCQHACCPLLNDKRRRITRLVGM